MLRRKQARLVLAAILLALVAFPGVAAADNEAAGTFGATFLQIPIGAKAMTVPGIVASARPDASLLFSNPAGLAAIPTSELYLTRSNWLDDLSLNAGGVVFRTPLDMRLSFGMRLLYSGDLTGYSASGEAVSTARFYDTALSTGLSRQFGGLGLGFGVTYVREHLPQENATGTTYSFGVAYRHGPHRFLVAAENLGGALKYPGIAYPIDSRMSFGYGRTFRLAWGTVELGSELTMRESDYQTFEIGAEYVANPFLTLRSGFGHVFSSPVRGESPLSAGLGLHIGRLTLDYAYTSREYFSNTHTVSFAYSFGKANGEAGEKETRRRAQAATPVHTKSTQTHAQRARKDVSERSTQPVSTGATGKPRITTPPPEAPAPVVVPEKTRPAPTERPVSYAVVAGKHARASSADAEARALRLLKIPARVQSTGSYFTVFIGRFDSRKDAQSALAKYRKQGHVFTIITIGP